MSQSPDLGPTPDQILRREGFRLLSARRIALPVWRVSIHSRILKRKRVAAIDEFVLRAIQLGISTEPEVRKLLNLPAEVTEAVVSSLVTDRHVRVMAGDSGPLLELSDSGAKLVESLVEERPVEKDVQFWIDGITGSPIGVSRAALLTGENLDEIAHLIVEPSDDVNLLFGPADTGSFAPFVTASGSGESLLSLLETGNVTKLYRPAVGLLFESLTDTQDRYVRVSIDGRSQPEIEEALRASGAVEGLRLDGRMTEDRMRIDRALGTQLNSIRSGDLQVEELRATFDRLGGTTLRPAQGDPNLQRPVTSSLGRVQRRLASIVVGRMGCAEAQESLLQTMSSARAEVLISTTRMWPREIDERYVAFIRQLLDAGVAVKLEIPADGRQFSKIDTSITADLEKACKGKPLAVFQTKKAHEASFVTVDGQVAFLFSGAPLCDLGYSSERFGDDRPVIINGYDEVQRFLGDAHGRD